MARRLLYGWHNHRGYLVSRYPPDSPIRPAVCLETMAEVHDMLKRQRADIMWIPKLTKDQSEKGL